jgi:putative hydrolase of the HAD superfamily
LSLGTIVFDLDDTLLDERPGRTAGRAAMEHTLREVLPGLSGRDLGRAYDLWRVWFWGDAERHRRGRLDLVWARREVVARALAELGHDRPGLADRAAQAFVAAAEAAQVLMPGARPVLGRLRARGLRLVLLTNGAKEPQSRKIERFALADAFDHVQIEGAFGVGKPEREAFRAAVAAVDTKPEQAMMVGNDWHHDVVGALEAGLHATFVDLAGGGAPGPAPRPHATIRAVEALPALLRDLEEEPWEGPHAPSPS